jgi:hypothetical protein
MKSVMRVSQRALLVFACGLQVLAATAQSNDESPYLTKTFPLASVKQLDTKTSGGNISVSGQSSGEAKVEMYVHANNNGWHNGLSKEEIQKRLEEEYDLTIGVENGTLKAIARNKEHFDNWGHGLSISFRIYVPESVSSEVHTSGGNIHLSDLSGTEDFATSGGNMDIEHLTGKIHGSTSGGNVGIADSKNDIDLQTSGGNMHATHCEGTIRMGTSGGNMVLNDVKGDIHATTSGGQITGEDITGELRTSTSGGNIHLGNLSCSLSASTSGGSIDVDLKTMGKYLDLSNSGGNISVSMPQGLGMSLTVSGERVHTSKMENFSGDIDKNSIAGTMNGGGIPVKVRGSGGNVELSFR